MRITKVPKVFIRYSRIILTPVNLTNTHEAERDPQPRTGLLPAGDAFGFLEQDILIDEEPFALSPVEAAVTEYALNQVDAGRDTLVMSAYPTQSLPVALAVALTYQHHPRRGCDGAPTVLFPRDGYTTVFDDIHYKHTCDPDGAKDSEPVPRVPVAAASNIPDEWRLYTAKREFRYDGTPQSTPAAIIVDLRAPRWGDTYAPQIERYVGAVDVPTILIQRENPALPVSDERSDA